jgi:DNA-binding XRE family transcriptional regulator
MTSRRRRTDCARTPEGIAIGANIRRLRTRAGLTQVELAEKAGVHRTTILLAEEARWKVPQMATLVAIACVLDCNVLDLFRARVA